MYNVGHRGRTSLFGIGVFGGSNGCWKRALLADIKMDPAMLTEDIDSSLRATLQGVLNLFSPHQSPGEECLEALKQGPCTCCYAHQIAGAKIGYCSQLISSEEAPETERTLRKQRLRWAQGWFEVSIKHLFSLLISKHTSLRQKVCFTEAQHKQIRSTFSMKNVY